MKQAQHRPQTRAPHGSPEFTELIAFRGSKDHKRLFARKGGSAWLRHLIDRQRQQEAVLAEAQALLDALDSPTRHGLTLAVTKLQTAIRKVQA